MSGCRNLNPCDLSPEPTLLAMNLVSTTCQASCSVLNIIISNPKGSGDWPHFMDKEPGALKWSLAPSPAQILPLLCLASGGSQRLSESEFLFALCFIKRRLGIAKYICLFILAWVYGLGHFKILVFIDLAVLSKLSGGRAELHSTGVQAKWKKIPHLPQQQQHKRCNTQRQM